MTDLAHLIDVVNVKLAECPALDAKSAQSWELWRAHGERVLQELRDDFGARIRTDRDPATMTMGGVKTSATGGWSALLSNWVNAARRKLMEN